MSLLDYRGYQEVRKKGFRWEKRRKNLVIERYLSCVAWLSGFCRVFVMAYGSIKAFEFYFLSFCFSFSLLY